MSGYTDEFLECLHTKCTANEDILNNSNMCGCFYCLKIFNTDEIFNEINGVWLNDPTGKGKTALCPYCAVDSVIPESDCGEYELNIDLLKKMNKYWFTYKNNWK